MALQPAVSWSTVDVGGASLELLRAAVRPPGDPLLFIPGWGLTPRAYTRALLPIAAGGLSVLAPSLPGFGSSTPLRLGAPLVAYAERVIALLDVLDPDKPVFLAGHSFGGGVALKVAELRPDLVRSVTVVNPVGGAPDRRGLRRASWLGWSLAATAAALPRLRPRLPDPGPLVRIAADFVPNVVRRPVRTAFTGAVALTAQLSAEAIRLAESGMPTLYVWGERDRLVLPGRLRGVGGPDASVVVSGGHGWMITHPDDFATTLHEALAVHALLEHEIRGHGVASPEAIAAVVAEVESHPEAPLAPLFPFERRRRARHRPPGPRAPSSTAVAAGR